MTIVMLILGLIGGFVLGWAAKTVMVAKERKEAAVRQSRTSSVQHALEQTHENRFMESYPCTIDKIDVNRKFTINVEKHLSDVVVDCKKSGKQGHLLVLVFRDYSEDIEKLEYEMELARHIVRLHKKIPHLALWLDDRNLDKYLRLLRKGFEFGDEGVEGRFISFMELKSEIAATAAASLAKDLGEDTKEGVCLNLVTQGLQRIDDVIMKNHPLHSGSPAGVA